MTRDFNPFGALGANVPVAIYDTTFGKPDLFLPSCGANGPESSYLFVAPTSGQYTISTEASSFDPVVTVYDATCGGAIVACNDDAAGLESSVTVNLTSGQAIVIQVDGAGPGEYGLIVNATNSVCDPTILDSVTPITTSGSTSGVSNLNQSCGGDGAPEAIYLFEAPTSDTYVFDTFGSEFDTILSVRDGSCNGPELACNDDASFGGTSQVSASLTAGQTIVVTVDGWGGSFGNYILNINNFVANCPAQNLGSSVPTSVNGTTVGAPDNVNPQCAQPGGDGPEKLFEFTAPASGTYLIKTNGSSFDTILSVLDTLCNGPTLGCNDDVSGVNVSSEVSVNLFAGHSVIIVVDGFAGSAGNFSLSITKL